MSVPQVLSFQADDFDGSSIPMAASFLASAARHGGEQVVQLLSEWGINARGDKLANTQALKLQLAGVAPGTRAEMARMACNVA